jgi:hypothetical protein
MKILRDDEQDKQKDGHMYSGSMGGRKLEVRQALPLIDCS